MQRHHRFAFNFLVALTILGLQFAAQGIEPPKVTGETYQVGIATADITPSFPVRLSGFGGRRTESEGVRQPIYAKAMAIADGTTKPAVLLTIDNLGVSASLRQRILDEVLRDGIHLSTLTISASHTHTAPMLSGICPTLFGTAIPADHQQHIDQYTEWLEDELVKLIRRSVADMRPSKLSYAVGKVSFAANRRTANGPVDHDLPTLMIRDQEGPLRAVYLNYACHCVTLSDNKISGDWAGYAQQAIERQMPGVTALVSIGCGADANPSSGVTGDRGDIAALQGAEIATEVMRLLQGFMQPVHGSLSTQTESINLALQALPPRSHWEELAKREDAVGFHAKHQLAILDRGEQLPDSIDYPIQTWTFGQSLAMVFLPGEVVVDYATRIKQRYDHSRLFINAYSNDSPGYVPSERILREGGYEGGGAMIYYGIPLPYATGLEEKIVAVIERQLGDAFRRDFDPAMTNNSLPMSAHQSAKAAQMPEGLRLDVAVAEPMVVDPVAIDFGADGRLWVAEMHDYPSGQSGNFEPGGQVRVLRDSDSDGQYDTSTVFADSLPFPTGITAWRDGVLVCAAPNIVYLPDVDNDDRADSQEILYSGFGTENYQARVNSLTPGLDGWLYGSCGLFGGKIQSHKTGEVIALGDRDFRIRPNTGEIEPAIGRTQQGRVRDDAGNWFGCDNSDLGRHYPIAEHYLRRNPHVVPLVTSVHLPRHEQGQTLFPIQSAAQRFKLSGTPGQTTAACGIGVYRDDVLGQAYQSDLFTCEPVNLVVHRMKIATNGSAFQGQRVESERDREFLASTDNWFRPVQAKTGPDGALWIVDMCRFIIEHPRWIPAEDLAKLDARAGHRLGRLYRVVPANWKSKPMPRLDQIELTNLPTFLDTENGWQRDMVVQLITTRVKNMTEVKGQGKVQAQKTIQSVMNQLVQLTRNDRARTRMTAVCLLGELAEHDRPMQGDWMMEALRDPSSEVRRQAIRIAENELAKDNLQSKKWIDALVPLVDDADSQVRLQLACTLGESKDAEVGEMLFRIAQKDWSDPILRSAVVSSLRESNIEGVVRKVIQAWDSETQHDGFTDFGERVFRSVSGFGKSSLLEDWLDESIASVQDSESRFSMACRLFQAVRLNGDASEIRTSEKLGPLLNSASQIAADDDSSDSLRREAIPVLGYLAANRSNDVQTMIRLLKPQYSTDLSEAALRRLIDLDEASIAAKLLDAWDSYGPTMQSSVLNGILQRPVWQAELLDRLEAGVFPRAALNATHREQLAVRDDPTWQSRLNSLWAGESKTSRSEVIAQYDSVESMQGDVPRGQALFEKRCAVCHRLRQQGHAVGPDLDMAAAKPVSFLLTEVLDPNRNVDSRYIQYVALTKDGLVINGLLAQENTNSLVFRGQENKETSLLRADLESMKSTGKSLMPEGLEKDLSQQDLADIFAYIASVPIPFKSFDGNTPQQVHADDTQLALLAVNAEIRGSDILFEQPYQNIGYWHGADDFVTWQVDTGDLDRCDVYLDYACDNSAAGNRMIVEAGKERIEFTVQGTGQWSDYRMLKIGELRLEGQPTRVIVRPAEVPKSATLDLRGLYFVASGQTPKMLDITAKMPKPDSAAQAAKLLLSAEVNEDFKKAILDDWSHQAADVIKEMARGIDSRDEEYRRIPMIWRIAILESRKNRSESIEQLLQLSLPKAGEPWKHWQAVVLGGAIINGLSMEGHSPAKRLAEWLGSDRELAMRYRSALQQSLKMAHDESIPSGTRYDALRIVALLPAEDSLPCLKMYLSQSDNLELQMGAVSGLSDIESESAEDLLLKHLSQLSDGNRKMAIDALLRTPERKAKLRDGMERKSILPDWLSDEQRRAAYDR